MVGRYKTFGVASVHSDIAIRLFPSRYVKYVSVTYYGLANSVLLCSHPLPPHSQNLDDGKA